MEYIPLQAAAKKFGVDEQVLTQLISAGMIESKTVSGGVLVAVDRNDNDWKGGDKPPHTKKEIIAAKFSHLSGQPISASEASRKYSNKHAVSISDNLFGRWANAGHITVLERGYRLLLDEAEVAYCAEIYALKRRQYEKKRMNGVIIFDENGNPYQLKYPEIAKKLRIERRKTREKALKVEP